MEYTISKPVVEFLKKHKDLINDNEFEDLYECFDDELATLKCSELTWVLSQSGIDFLSYMKEIPFECFIGLAIKEIKIPDNIELVRSWVFAECNLLEKVELSDNIYSIGRNCFRDCIAMKSLKLPKSLQDIHAYAFSGCSKLEKIELPESVEYIGERAFELCTELKSITIPENVIEIDEEAFRNCTNLEEVIIKKPKLGRMKLEAGIFHGTKVNKIKYLGTMKEWEPFNQEPDWRYERKIKEIECTDGVIKVEYKEL